MKASPFRAVGMSLPPSIKLCRSLHISAIRWSNQLVPVKETGRSLSLVERFKKSAISVSNSFVAAVKKTSALMNRREKLDEIDEEVFTKRQLRKLEAEMTHQTEKKPHRYDRDMVDWVSRTFDKPSLKWTQQQKEREARELKSAGETPALTWFTTVDIPEFDTLHRHGPYNQSYAPARPKEQLLPTLIEKKDEGVKNRFVMPTVLRLRVRYVKGRNNFYQDLPFGIKAGEIEDWFSKFELANIRQPVELITYGLGCRFSGAAFVYFQREEEARRAKRMLNHKWFGNRYLRIDLVQNDKCQPRIVRYRFHLNNRMRKLCEDHRDITTEAIIALDFQPHPINEGWKGIERLAAAAGSLIKIWSFSLLPFSRLISLNGTCEIGTDDIAMGSNQCSVDQTIDADCPTNVSRCHTRSQCVALLRDHAPAYLVGLRFSPTGHLLASCDSRQILLWEFIRFSYELAPSSSQKNDDSQRAVGSERPPVTQLPDEVWKTRLKMIDTQSDIFDLCWSGDDRLVTGGVDCIKIWSVEERRLSQVIRYSEGFVKGVVCHARRYIAAQSNEKRVVVWSKSKTDSSCGFQVVVDESELFNKGPSDLPYSRRGSFDPAGKLVAFPNGQRGCQYFGVAFHLDQTQLPFRFRGHLQRVNSVSFSRGVWTADDSDQAAPNIKFTLYAQASTDGALSAWKFFYPSPSPSSSESPPVAKCFLVLKPRLFDEQASVTDMSWTPEGLCLAVAADDGSITLVVFKEEELHGNALINPHPWNRVKTWQVPPRHPNAPLEVPTKRPSLAELNSQMQQPNVAVIETKAGPSTSEKARRRIAPILVSSTVSMDQSG